MPSFPAPSVLFWGDDAYLLREEALDLLGPLDVQVTEVEAGEWAGGETSDLATPSLWGEPRALLVTDCHQLPEAGAAELRAYLGSPSPNAICVLTQTTQGRNAPPLAKAVTAGGGRVRQVAIARRDLTGWVVQRARRREVQMSGPAAAALVDTLGQETATLDRAVEQLANAFPNRAIGPSEVHAQFRGLGEQKVWDLCDRAFTGRLPEALVVLRSLRADGGEALLIVGGIASRLRDLIKVRALPDRMPPAEALRAAGLRFDWQLRRYREQAARYSPADLAALHERVTETDRAIKAGMPEDVLLPELVAALATTGGAPVRERPGAAR